MTQASLSPRQSMNLSQFQAKLNPLEHYIKSEKDSAAQSPITIHAKTTSLRSSTVIQKSTFAAVTDKQQSKQQLHKNIHLSSGTKRRALTRDFHGQNLFDRSLAETTKNDPLLQSLQEFFKKSSAQQPTQHNDSKPLSVSSQRIPNKNLSTNLTA